MIFKYLIVLKILLPLLVYQHLPKNYHEEQQPLLSTILAPGKKILNRNQKTKGSHFYLVSNSFCNILNFIARQ